jgi:hypothetical protein
MTRVPGGTDFVEFQFDDAATSARTATTSLFLLLAAMSSGVLPNCSQDNPGAVITCGGRGGGAVIE